MAGFSTSSEHELQSIMAPVLTGRILRESLRVGVAPWPSQISL